VNVEAVLNVRNTNKLFFGRELKLLYRAILSKQLDLLVNWVRKLNVNSVDFGCDRGQLVKL